MPFLVSKLQKACFLYLWAMYNNYNCGLIQTYNDQFYLNGVEK